jgi:hypothetical protein
MEASCRLGLQVRAPQAADAMDQALEALRERPEASTARRAPQGVETEESPAPRQQAAQPQVQAPQAQPLW